MESLHSSFGLAGHQAPELNIPVWVDGEGQTIDPVKLSDYSGKFKVLHCFQAWCPGCHSRGLPSLKKLVDAFTDDERISFLAIQTVFEGKEVNTYDKLLEVQQNYELKIPFAHDEGDSITRNVPSVMYDYRTGGTPWFVFIDKSDKVVFNGFHIDAANAIEYLNAELAA